MSAMDDESMRKATDSEARRLHDVEQQVFALFDRMNLSPSEAMTVVTAIGCRLAIVSANLSRGRYLECVAASYDFYASRLLPGHRRGVEN